MLTILQHQQEIKLLHFCTQSFRKPTYRKMRFYVFLLTSLALASGATLPSETSGATLPSVKGGKGSLPLLDAAQEPSDGKGKGKGKGHSKGSKTSKSEKSSKSMKSKKGKKGKKGGKGGEDSKSGFEPPVPPPTQAPVTKPTSRNSGSGDTPSKFIDGLLCDGLHSGRLSLECNSLNRRQTPDRVVTGGAGAANREGPFDCHCSHP
jgi:hypothetical protein